MLTLPFGIRHFSFAILPSSPLHNSTFMYVYSAFNKMPLHNPTQDKNY